MSAATPEHIMQVGLGFWASKTLLSAVELGVFSTLADAPADLPTLQRKLALHQRSARDFVDALVALKLLDRENGVYSNTVDTDLFLDRAKPSCGSLCRSGSAAGVSDRDERDKRGSSPRHCRQLPMERLQDLHGSWFSSGHGTRHSRLRPSPPRRHRFRPSRSQARLRGIYRSPRG